MTEILFVPDLEALRRKFADPSPVLARLLGRFRERLACDGEFRRHHIFLPALLGDPVAIAEAKGQVLTLAFNPLILAKDQSPASRSTAQESLDSHIWCVTPRAMRLAVYYTWLDAHGAWSPGERRRVGTALMDFFDYYVIPVLRARVPGGHNQQFSMTFCSAVVGQAFAEVDEVSGRAQALRDWALPKFKQVLGLMPSSGYSGEGSTYQSDVVSPLVMWAGVFLAQVRETASGTLAPRADGSGHVARAAGSRSERVDDADIWLRKWDPNGASLADTLRMEAAMGSCGGLLPPWDQYGWARIHNLAARTLWAALTGDSQLLRVAESAWDEESFIGWRHDDRLWTLVYWPEREAGGGGKVEGGRPQTSTLDPRPSPPLSGWSLPAVGAAIEHQPRRLRVMSVWDACSGGVQSIGRGQVNPNHLMIDLRGEPITADGYEPGRVRLVSESSYARTLQTLPPVEQEMIARQYGSVEAWLATNQQGCLGQSCGVVVDAWESYFPRQAREGRLVFERRDAGRHTFAGEAAAYYQPAFDVTRMRRTVSMNAVGIAWVVDDLRAATAHDFTWRAWLRRGARMTGPLGVRLDLASSVAMTFAWRVEGDDVTQTGAVSLTTVPTFPSERGLWPEDGSERCDVTASGLAVRFVTCLVPEGVDGLTVRQAGAGVWEAVWAGGADRFEWPGEIDAVPDPETVRGEQIRDRQTLCDLDEKPIGLLDESDSTLLAALDAPPVREWRRTGAVMQTLAVRGNREAFPKIVALLRDGRQNYTVHSVAAWCLGHARYAPALEVLRQVAHIPEVNTAARARWAVERIKE